MSVRSATALAHPNIALAKYWGKREIPGNVPATPSVSITLAGLDTRTTLSFDPSLKSDELLLDRRITAGRPLDRVSKLLDEVRARAKVETRARVVSMNAFPTASGLASSASGFAALARAACSALDLPIDDAEVSRIARRASASAARSIFGGFVALGTEDDAAAEPIATAAHWPIAVVVAETTAEKKAIGSTQAMEHCRRTSPYFHAWVADAHVVAATVRRAIVVKDLELLGVAAEASAMRMHACMLAASPAVAYWSAATIALLDRVRALRKEGVGVWATIDAGPHVKAICAESDAPKVAEALAPLAKKTLIAKPGEGAVARTAKSSEPAAEDAKEKSEGAS